MFHIPLHHAEFFDMIHPLDQKKMPPPPPPPPLPLILMRKVKNGEYDEMVQRLMFTIENKNKR